MLVKKIQCLLGLLFSILSVCFAQEVKWQKKPITIESRWSKDVVPDAPLSDYPRPQLQRPNWESLNGLWDCSIVDDHESVPSAFLDKILVPYPIESSLSGVKKTLMPYQAIWYRKSFKTPFQLNGRKLLLHFGAVDYQATVYLNGKEIGQHSGGYTSFTFDLTKFLRKDSNEILVKVIDPTDQGSGPHGKQVIRPGEIYYTSSSGIWQTVWLESVPETYITSLRLTPDIDQKELLAEVKLNDNGCKNCVVELEVSNGVKVKGLIGHIIKVPIKEMHTWSPEDPYLYDCYARIYRDGAEVDNVKSYFGMRKISILKGHDGKERIFLNNKYYYNLGILDQGYWPEGIYTAPTDEALAFDINISKLMGFNTIRKHIKIEPARWYYHADKIGMLVWQDFVNPNQSLSTVAKSAFERQIGETINQLYNAPSIVTWVIFNEKWGQYDQQRITEWVKEMDSTRLVNGHSGELLYVDGQLKSPSPNPYISADMTDVHSYPYPRLAPYQSGKVNVLGEFGGLGVSVQGHLWDDLNTGWGYSGILSPNEMIDVYRKMIDTLVLLKEAGLSASIYTQPYDVESELNGIMTYDRKVIKIPLDTICRINSRLVPNLAAPEMRMISNNMSLDLPEAVYRTYTQNCNEYKNGRRDSSFLRALTIHANKEHDDINISKYCDDYFKSLQNPFSEINLLFLQRFVRDANSSAFTFIAENSDSIRKIDVGEETLKVVRGIIKSDFLSMKKDDMTQADWDALIETMRRKYGSEGELAVQEERALYYYLKKDIPRFVDVKSEIHRKYPKSIGVFDLNNDAWAVFENTGNKELLATAIKWSEKVVRMEPTANYYDTYANLLYRLGKKDMAIQAQEAGLKLAVGNGIFEDIVKNLEKMKKGEPTWGTSQ
ncbi:sugar-binding domain-containing protein [Chitinophaga rhizophila]|uniref:Glycoside hydrolase family 2 n=1 Tax=Chitinophaga rhizophila TaxID=2866212 RepID=A0ABS7GGF8_9BACT|nr:sugar-binding domain-containing protein [Chitinophaga rhizophila]MBW8685573.1 glycoside hydrolase family 2 [Chitinophaga rhizophila]